VARPRNELQDIQPSARNTRLLRWLRRKPQPAKLLGETDDGEEVTCAINGTGPATYRDALTVVRECVTIKALDKEGNEIRRIELDPDDPELRAEHEQREALRAVSRSGGGSVPIISVDLPKLVDNIARNMREVASEAARQHSQATRDGWTAMVGVVNIALKLLVQMESRLDAAVDAATPEQPDEGDQRNGLAMMALQKAMGNGAPNGVDPNAIASLLQQLQQQPGGQHE